MVELSKTYVEKNPKLYKSQFLAKNIINCNKTKIFCIN